MTGNADMIAYWNEVSGDKWVRLQPRLDAAMAPLGARLLAAATPAPGERTLDVGCGCGALALGLAEAVGRDGDVLALDVSAPMLAHARRRADALGPGAAPLEFVEADASSHAFAGDRDLVASRFGLMFFADPQAAFANLRRALRPGGRLAATTWRERAAVDWMQAPLDWIAPVLPPPERSEGRPGPFGLADRDATCRMLATAGFGAVEAEPLDLSIPIGGTLDEALVLLNETGPAAATMREAEPAAREAALRRVREGAAARLDPDGALAMGAACWLYRAVA